MTPNMVDPIQLASAFWDGARAGVAVACSAGGDSLAALTLLATSRQRSGRKLWAFHVNHGWRGEAAAREDAAVVKQVASRLAVDVLVTNSIPPTEGSPEMKARLGRYRALGQLCVDHDVVDLVTAHHADDQIETRLLAILRQSRPEALLGIRPVRELTPKVTLQRPFLACTRMELRQFAPPEALHDPSNDDDRFTRNALRHRVLTQVRDPFALRVALEGLSDAAQRALQFASEQAENTSCATCIDEGLLEIDIAAFAALSPLARDLTLDRATRNDPRFPRWTPARRQLVDAAIGLDPGTGGRGAPRGERIVVDGPRVYFDVFRSPGISHSASLPGAIEVRWGPRRLSIAVGSTHSIAPTLEVIPAQPGLRLQSGERLVDAWRRHRVPPVWRQRLPVVVLDGCVHWFPGIIPSENTEPSVTVKVIEGPEWPSWPTN